MFKSSCNANNIRGVSRHIFFAFLVIMLTSTGCDSSGGGGVNRDSSVDFPFLEVVPPSEGGTYPEDFTIALYSGGTFSLKENLGHPIVINFWASWCGPCKLEAPGFEAAYKKYSKEGVRFIGIDVQDSPAKGAEFIKSFGITYPNGFDPRNELMDYYNVYGIPKTFILDKTGEVVFIHTGALFGKPLKEAIERAM